MLSTSFRSNLVAIGVFAALSNPTWAEPKDATVQPLPKVSEATIRAMTTAFAQMPLECRTAVQQSLKQYGMYEGASNGRWSAGLGQGLIAYVQSTGNLAYGWRTVAGSKGILWSIVGDDMLCPIELLGL